jgi:phosphomannomutase/phosphoglucomutase
MAYFAQFDLDVPCVAMVTASHTDNGWTGVKMGTNRPLTFGPDEMTRLKDIVLGGKFKQPDGGAYEFVENFPARYIADLTKRPKLTRHLKVVCACGNGTAGAFAPHVLEKIGCEVVPLDCELDHTFPKYNPNTEDMKMLHAMRDAVLASKADVGLGFDGDGDRCGVVDNTGDEIFADKVGVMLARDISSNHPGAQFVADVKSTGLFATDPVLIKNGAKTDYWKTGHSYMKRRVNEIGAIAGFEKSGHFFFNKPFGRGYDDGLIFAMAVCDMLDRNPGKSMADLKNALPKTWSSPTMAPHCADEEKYGVVDAVVKHFEGEQKNGAKVAGQAIRDLVTVNGVRVTVEDGTWGLVRASSNKPSSSSKARSRKHACAICSNRSMPSCAPTSRSANTIRRFETVLPAVAGANRELHFLKYVDLEHAGKHRAPGLQIDLHARIAGDALAAQFPVLDRLVVDDLHELRRVVDVLQEAHFGFAEHLVERRRGLDHGGELT